MNLSLHPFRLRLRHPFGISRGVTTVQGTLIVELEQDGQRGYGEVTEGKYYGVTVEKMAERLEAIRGDIEAASVEDPGAFWRAMNERLGGDRPFELSALDAAAIDLWGKLRGEPVWKLWGLDLANCPPSDYTIGIDTIETMVAKLNEFPGWPVYKIKLGTPNDLEIVKTLRGHTDAVFRVDANCAWTAEETLRNAEALVPLGVEFIEQPLPAEEYDAMRRICAKSALPLVADESCRVPSDVARCEGCFHGINIKLCKCGGLTPALGMIEEAHSRGMTVMVGCMTESTVGISAIGQLLPLLDYVDMDGAVLLAEDVADGVRLRQGQAVYPDENGSGIRFWGERRATDVG